MKRARMSGRGWAPLPLLAASALAGCAAAAANDPLPTIAVPTADGHGECRRPASSTECERISSALAATPSNPQGRWALGSQTSLTAPLELYDAFAMNPPPTGQGEGIAYWKKGTSDWPCAALNPSCQPYVEEDVRIAPGEVVLRPGHPGQYSVARWVPGRSGAVRVHATFRGISLRDGRPATSSDVHVRRGFVELSSGAIKRGDAANTFLYDGRVPVAVGETLDFLVGASDGDPVHSSTGVDIEICYELLPH